MISFCLRNPAFTLLATVLLAAAGFWAWTRVPVDAIPDLSDNQVIVWAEWPGKSPEDVDLQVTARLARELQGLQGVRTVRGLSLYGAGYAYVIFEDRRDLYACRTRVLERLSQVQAQLPAGVQARLGPDATAMGQVYAFVLQGRRDPEAKRHLLDQLVVPALRAVPGVAEVAPVGGVVREYQVEVDPQRLRAQGLTLDDVMMALARAGRDVGAMSVERSGVETMIRGVGFVRSARQVEDAVLRGDPARGAGLRLGQVATVQVGGAVRQGLLADQHGEQAGAIVALRVGEDPSAVIRAVKERLAGLEPALSAEGLSAAAFYDRSLLIAETRDTLVRTLVEELVVTVLVVAAFLLHARASLAVAAVLPLGVLLTFLAMHAAGVGANIMTLAGIAIAIGVMVDFGIVMTENITQHLVALQQRRAAAGLPSPSSPADPEVVEACIAGAREVGRPLLTAAATTVIGFLPIFVLDDQAGRLFVPLAVTKTLAIAAAVLFGMLLVPVLCRLLLPPWRAGPALRAGLAGLAAGAVGAWFLPDGLRLPIDHGRWAVAAPGWLAAPLLAGLAAWLAWRLGAERLVGHEDNPSSRVIHAAYDWALARIQRHRALFATSLLGLALAGWLVGLGWTTLSWPLRQAVAWTGGDLAALAADRWLARTFPGIGGSFLPPLDEGSLLFMPSVPATAGLGEAQRVMEIQNRLIAQVPEVASLMGKLGRAETALDPAPIGMVETVVLLKPYRDWPVHDIAGADGRSERRPRTLAEVRAALSAAADIPGVAPSWLQPIETRVVMLSTGIRSLIALQLQGGDGPSLERFAEKAEKIIAGVPGAVDVQVQREGGKPYAEIRLDPERLARFGLTAEQVMAAVEGGLGGMPVLFSVEGTQRYGARVRWSRELRDDDDEALDLPVPLPADGMGGAGRSVPLSALAAIPTVFTLGVDDAPAWLAAQPPTVRRAAVAIAPGTIELTLPAGERPGSGRILAERPAATPYTATIGPMAIRSEAGRRVQYVLLNVAGRGEVEVVRDADRALRAAIADRRLEPPSGATWRWVGRYEQKLKADATMRWVIGASLLIMVVLIYVGTRSWLVTAIIIGCNLTVTTAGGFLFVWWWGAEMTTAVAVGFLVLLGVMFNDGILLGTYLHEAFRTPPRDVDDLHRRVFEAGLRRRRPALMTNCTTLLSLVPVLWADGRGAELMRPMVLPIIGGMVFDLVSLFSVPVFYAWWHERRLAARREAPVRAVASPP